MLSVFGLTFLIVYVVLKWRYVLPSVYGEQPVNWSVWPYSLSSGGIALGQVVLGFPRVSHWAAYTQLFLSIYSVASPKSNAWKCCIVSLVLSCMHVFRNGLTSQIVVATIVLLLTLKYFHHTRHWLPTG